MAIKPWPLPIRLIHWLMVGLITADLLFLETGERAHKFVGFTLAGLVCIRLALLGLSRNPAYKINLPKLAAIKQQITQRQWAYTHHSPLGALMICTIWGLLLAAATSGYLQTTDALWGEEWVEQLHSVIVYSLFTAIALHVSAIALLQRRAKLPLVQRMWRGVPDKNP
ncbi:MAG TPA: cytochrome b/b6 domain-containing protein [Cellvibrionaceae bacterium]|nr:cytochrome b/b6 domain-containing protein [Cellvibrionaceae bacterium]HMW73498.1 cytochrome b/b6 domain-containing protein [Cellvibrionaceae bacterium]HMY40867.1 cytochrome b/b6 domain-containing protein [Marinagarivorans sp.]HNG60511.1 cytochrome b/b6 domain-containing protein [Cellvibrionaceae bacterium]